MLKLSAALTKEGVAGSYTARRRSVPAILVLFFLMKIS